MYDRKLVIVQNPYSTRHSEVQTGVFDRFDEAGIAYDTITTRFSQAEDNIRDLADHLPQDAHIISAAGDGTSAQMVNAGPRAELNDAVYSFIGYGNCNDLARGQRDPLPLLHTNRRIIIHQPLSIEVNSEPWRYAPEYMTLGLTALVASGFASAASRERLRHTPAERITDITLNFREPATIIAQTEGEHAVLPAVSTIRTYKDPAKAIRVVRHAV